MVFASRVILGSGSCRIPDRVSVSGLWSSEYGVSSLVMSNKEVECGPLQFRLIGVLILRERPSDFIAE